MDDTVQAPNLVYHHGSVGGAPGVFVDNPSDPSDYQSVFTPSGLDPTQSYSFGLSPKIGPSGERYYDKVVWQAGPRQAVLQVDRQGRPIKAFAQDTGEANEAAISPFDFFGPAEAELVADGLSSVGKVVLRPLTEAIGDAVAKVGLRGASEELLDGAAEPAFQLGGAHSDVRGVPGYEAHHMPADSVSSIPTGEGPAIAMLPKS